MKRRLVLAILICLVGILGAERITVQEFEQRIFDQTNAQRVKHGLQPLLREPVLDDLAKLQSRFMGVHDFFDHTDHEGNDATGRLKKYFPYLYPLAASENIWMEGRSDRKHNPEQAVIDWMHSPGHRANILDPEVTHLGVGIYVTGERLYATQNFAAPDLRLKSKLPRKFVRNRSYRLDFEYISPLPKDDFFLGLHLPDPTTKVMISENKYYEGMAPQRLDWKDERNFSVTITFKYGKGTYTLTPFRGSSYIPDMMVFIVR